MRMRNVENVARWRSELLGGEVATFSRDATHAVPQPAWAGRLLRGEVIPLIAAILLLSGCAPQTKSAPAATKRPAPVVGKIEVDEEFVAPDVDDTPFTLTDQRGEPFSSESLRGKVWMGAIFFANCPGPCFRENQAIADILREIDDPNFMVVSLTCDPENDTPESLKAYAARFDADPARWKFLTGDLKLIEKIGQQTFRLPVELGVHSERGVVFDREGRLRGGYHLLQQDRVDLLKKLIREVLAEPSGPAAGAATGGGEKERGR